MRHESKSSFSYVWGSRRIRVLAHGISGRLRPVSAAGQTAEKLPFTIEPEGSLCPPRKRLDHRHES